MIKPSFLFTDHAVLQRGKRIAVFGTCDTDALTVSFDAYSVSARVENGNFIAYLPPLEGGVRGELVFTARKERLVCRDIVTGDVWLAAGQSNMEHPTFSTLYEESDIAEDTDVRLFTVPRKRNRAEAEWGWHFQAVFSEDTPWVIFGGEESLRFSGVAVHFVKELRKHTDVPIGLIS